MARPLSSSNIDQAIGKIDELTEGWRPAGRTFIGGRAGANSPGGIGRRFYRSVSSGSRQPTLSNSRAALPCPSSQVAIQAVLGAKLAMFERVTD